MNTTPEIFMSSPASDECHQMLNALLLQWPEKPSDFMSSAILDHFCRCRSCLQKWIALEAAADLASLSILGCDAPRSSVDQAAPHPAGSLES